MGILASGSVTAAYGTPRPAPEATIPYTSWGTHPSILAQWHVMGRGVKAIEIEGGRAFVGYGNYTYNTGPLDLAYFDLTTHSPGVALADMPTEEYDRFRRIGGHLYIPRLDSTPTPGWDGVGGYATDASGSWANSTGPMMIHTFDVASLTGSDMWLAGSAFFPEGARGVLYRSPSPGAPWSAARTLPVSDESRFYSSVVCDGKLLACAHDGDIHIFDGSTWSTVAAVNMGLTWHALGSKVLGTGAWLNSSGVETPYVFDSLPDPTSTIRNIYVTQAGSAYALTDSGHVLKATVGASSVTWAPIGATSKLANSPTAIAVDGADLYYAGGSNGEFMVCAGVIV